MTSPASTSGKPLAHPPGLSVLFGAEACERLSYYGMRALLTLYLVNHLKFPREDALAVYGAYTGLVYLTPLLGGTCADRLLGRRKAVLIGGSLMALGHLAMAFEPLFYLALGLLVLGNGFFKPNISTMVGGLYHLDDTRRDSAFTIFYMGINFGAYLAPVVCGNLGEILGWHYGFSAAAVAMVLGLAVFLWGQRWFGQVGLPPGRADGNSDQPVYLVRRDYLDVALWVGAGALLVWSVLRLWRWVGPVWDRTGVVPRLSLLGLLIAGALYWLFRHTTREEAQRLLALVMICLFNIFFWMGFEQAGGTMTLFADQQTDRVLGWVGILVVAGVLFTAGITIHRVTRKEAAGGALWSVLTGFFIVSSLAVLIFGVARKGHIEFATSQFMAVNPLLIVALAPSFSRLWQRLDQGRFRTSTPTKMALGMLILGVGFVVMYIGQGVAAHGKVSPAWLAAVYTLHTMGELCLSPIGLSMVTKLAPARNVSFAMGLWFGSSAIANYLAGTLEKTLDRHQVPIYGFLIASSILPAVFLFALVPVLKRWSHGRA